MYKTIGIYKNLKDIGEFERFYVSEVMPKMLKLPGVIKMNVTDCSIKILRSNLKV
jgi:hypothetical protein